MKKCSHCRETKPLTAFAVDKTRRDGRQRLCRDCMAERKRAWMANPSNRQRANAASRARRAANLDKALEREKREREIRADQRAAEWRRWATRNADHRREYEQRYREENADQRRDWEAARRARKNHGRVESVNALVLLELHDGQCGICGGDVDPLRFDIDHVVPLVHGGEHSYANTQPAHPVCNYRKGHRMALAVAA